MALDCLIPFHIIRDRGQFPAKGSISVEITNLRAEIPDDPVRREVIADGFIYPFVLAGGLLCAPCNSLLCYPSQKKRVNCGLAMLLI
jgi:hypothetical protein